MGTQDTEDTREGGRADGGAVRPPDVLGDRLRRARNSSGDASQAANLLDIRQKLLLHAQIIGALCERLGDPELALELTRDTQRGFRRNRSYPRGSR